MSVSESVLQRRPIGKTHLYDTNSKKTHWEFYEGVFCTDSQDEMDASPRPVVAGIDLNQARK
jgi:hypothetical protein